MQPDNLDAGKEFGSCHRCKVCTCPHYLGGYIGDDESKSNGPIDRILTWEKNINMISKGAGKYPHGSYDAVVYPGIQGMRSWEWRNDSGNFFLCLLFGKTKTLSPIVGTLSTMPIKVARLGLLNLVTSLKEKYLSSQRGSAELVRDVTGGGVFPNAYHLQRLE